MVGRPLGGRPQQVSAIELLKYFTIDVAVLGVPAEYQPWSSLSFLFHWDCGSQLS